MHEEKKREVERERKKERKKEHASMASIMLLQTAGLIGFAHGFRPYSSAHKR